LRPGRTPAVRTWQRHRSSPARDASNAAHLLSSGEAVSTGARLLAIAALRAKDIPKPARERYERLARQAIDRIVLDNPRNGYLQAWKVLDGTRQEQPLTPKELTTLRAAAQAPEFRLPLRELGAALLAPFAPDAPSDALGLAVGALPLDAHVLLRYRAKATLVTADRQAAAAILGAAGEKMGAGPSLLDRTIGSALAIQAAKLMEDPAAIALAEARSAEVMSFLKPGEKAAFAVLPIRLLRIAALRRTFADEVGYIKMLQ
jgi:hypothetical protein